MLPSILESSTSFIFRKESVEMNFPLNLALFSFMIIRSPANIVNYNLDPYTNGIPSVQPYEYRSDSIFFQSYEEPFFSINGFDITYQLGFGIDSFTHYTNNLYFSYLPTISYNYEVGTNRYYWNEMYTPIYIADDYNITGDNLDIFRIEFDYDQSNIDINFCMDLNNGYDKRLTWNVLNNEFAYLDNNVNDIIRSYYYNYTFVLQAYYGSFEADSIYTANISDFYVINLKQIYNQSYPNITTSFRKNLATIPTNLDWDNSILAIKLNVLYESYKQIDKQSYNTGYNDGYENGIQSELNPNNWIYSFVKSTFNGLSDILNVEVLPNVKIGTFLAIPLVFSVVMFILSFFKKGG